MACEQVRQKAALRANFAPQFQDMSVRVRFAPSPTGPQHIGGIRTALYNYLFARRMNGTFVLRIEDTDQKRYVAAAEDYLMRSLAWCGLTPDEGPGIGGDFGPYRQSERKDIYEPYAMQLLESGQAYWAFDTEEELDAWRKAAEEAGNPPPKYDAATRGSMRNSLSLSADEVEALLNSDATRVLRLKVPEGETITFRDEIRGEVRFSSAEVDDKVIWKADGMPTYHLANVVDDHLMQISHVIRGEEWLSSGPLHVLLYRAFGWTPPVFAHLPLILNPNGKGKLSKRAGDKFGFPVFTLDWTDPESGDLMPGYDSQGFEPSAFLNFLAFLGWNPGDERELFTLAELEQAFSLERVGKSGARFDFDKAKWFNAEHLKTRSNAEIAEALKPILEAQGASVPESGQLEAIAGMMKERVTFISEIPEQGNYFFGEVPAFEAKVARKKYKPERRAQLEELISDLEGLEDFGAEAVEAATKEFMSRNELGFGAVLPAIRLAIAGTLNGPPAFEMMSVLGKSLTVQRMREGLDRLDAAVQEAV